MKKAPVRIQEICREQNLKKFEGQAVRPALFCYYYTSILYFMCQYEIHLLEYSDFHCITRFCVVLFLLQKIRGAIASVS
jgi:hypothetical protein